MLADALSHPGHSRTTCRPHITLSHLQSGPHCTYMSYCCTATRTTLHPYTAQLRPRSKPHPARTRHLRTRNPDQLPPVPRSAAPAIWTSSHLYTALLHLPPRPTPHLFDGELTSNWQRGTPRPSDAIYCHTCSPAQVPPTPPYRRTCNPPLAAPPARLCSAEHHLPAACGAAGWGPAAGGGRGVSFLP